MEGAHINMKLIIGNRESGIRNWSLVHYLSKPEGYFRTEDLEKGIGIQELVPCALLWYVKPKFQKCKSGIRNQFPVPVSL